MVVSVSQTSKVMAGQVEVTCTFTRLPRKSHCVPFVSLCSYSRGRDVDPISSGRNFTEFSTIFLKTTVRYLDRLGLMRLWPILCSQYLLCSSIHLYCDFISLDSHNLSSVLFDKTLNWFVLVSLSILSYSLTNALLCICQAFLKINKIITNSSLFTN